ncbi:MAG: arginine--tRNA ligase [Acidobacteria bacterium]|nr:arginine--tRNA ligase [Acidobacteriota bacterium]
MILALQDDIRRRIETAVQSLYGLGPESIPAVTVGYPPSREMGDLTVTLAFELARRLRKAPRVIATELAARLGPIPGILRVEVTPQGYLNFFIDRPAFLTARLAPPPVDPASPAGRKTVVEHTAINPNKAAHIGHLRNATLGDTLVRVLRFRGVPVEVQNYIDDTGVQVADVVVGFRELEHLSLDTIRSLADSTRFDYYCWDLYARVTEWYEHDETRLAVRSSTLHEIERGGSEASAIGAFITDRIVRCHLETMARLNVYYDLLAHESDILQLQFWATAFEILKQRGAVFLQPQGRLAGCWVMPIAAAGGDAAPGAPAAGEGDPETDEAREKVIVRSNGTVTYVGKDMAYQFWKFGLLGRDFHYREFCRQRNGKPLWMTTSEPQAGERPPASFGNAGAVYNVIDVRQSYLQELLKQGLVAIGHPEEAGRSVHFSYEMVALSHQTARQLGYDSSSLDPGRPFVEVSGRKGLGVKADDLLDAMVAKADIEVTRRNPELDPAGRRRIAELIAVAAVRYFLIKFSRGKVIAFDIDEALNFEGETGPYLQYAVVRANNIFLKLREREGLEEAGILGVLGDAPGDEIAGGAHGHDIWALVLEASRLDEVVEQVVRTLEFSVLAKYAFGLAQMFNAFYHKYPILNEEQVSAKRWRAAAASYCRVQLTRALDLMGIQVPPRM